MRYGEDAVAGLCVCVCLHFMCSSIRVAPIFVYNPTLGLHMQAPLRNRMTPKAKRASGRYAPGFRSRAAGYLGASGWLETNAAVDATHTLYQEDIH